MGMQETQAQVVRQALELERARRDQNLANAAAIVQRNKINKNLKNRK